MREFVQTDVMRSKGSSTCMRVGKSAGEERERESEREREVELEGLKSGSAGNEVRF
jgi:hypothetical protein